MTLYDIHGDNRVFLELFNGSAHPMWIFDLETLKYLAVNQAAEEVYGYTRDEFLAMTVLAIRSPEEGERFKKHLKNQKDGTDKAGRWQHLKKDGSVLHVDITARKIRFDGKNAEMVLAIDVTSHVEALRDLKTAENMYRGLVEHSMVGIYIVQNMKFAYTNPRLSEMFGYTPEELSNMSLLDLTLPEQRDDVIAAIRERMTSPNATGRRVFTGVRKDGSQIITDIHNARVDSRDTPIMMGVVLDITDAKRGEIRAQEHVAHLERMISDTLRTISTIGEIRDAYTAGHESRVGNLSAAIGAELGMNSREQNTLLTIGIVHDTGKIGVPSEILSKPGRLSAQEYELVKTHVQTGFDILKLIEFNQPVAEAALQHHERIDGSGYPRGLKGDQMLPLAKIIAVADVVESMGSHRPYRAALGIDIALDEISKNAGKLYDAEVSAACLKLFRDRGYQIH